MNDAGLRAQRELSVKGSAPVHGIFDFGPERDDAGTVWFSYSAVDDSKWPGVMRVSTHLARSDDNGLTLVERVVLNENTYLSLEGQGLPVDGGLWQHEVSRLRHDPWAPEAERWVLVWHRYLALPAPVPANEQRRFEHGWISLKTAASPEGPWSAERKLITAEGYRSADDAIIGPPEVRLATISSGLTDCPVATEPGLLTRPTEWLMTLQCAGTASRIIVLRKDRASGTWSLLGSVLTRATAAQAGFDSFASSELVEREGRTYLIVSPSVGDLYRGCRGYEITGLSPLAISATPVVTLGLGASDFNFAGGCGYVDGLETGIIEGQLFQAPPEFRVFATFTALP